MSQEAVLYVGAVQDLYVTVSGFMVDGKPADPTSYAASLALVASDEDVDESAWTPAAWVDEAAPPLCKALYGDPDPLSAGTYWLYLKLQGSREKLICQAGRVQVRSTP